MSHPDPANEPTPERTTEARRAPVSIGVGMPASLHLDDFGTHVAAVFGTLPMLVGSACKGKQWRDVDVRLILFDDECVRLFGTASPSHLNGRWVALCMAFSALGQKMTGLPIDFQIQGMTHANKLYGGEPRNAIGMTERSLVKECRETPDGVIALREPEAAGRPTPPDVGRPP